MPSVETESVKTTENGRKAPDREWVTQVPTIRRRFEAAQKIAPPHVKHWEKITLDEYQSLVQYLNRIKTTAQHITTTDAAGNPIKQKIKITDAEGNITIKETEGDPLNLKEDFQTHLDIMHAYVDSICQSIAFVRWLRENGVSVLFLHALVELHDMGRMIFNLQGPLTYNDNVSGAFIFSNLLKTFPVQNLHSIRIVTGEKKIPDDGKTLNFNESISLILKAIDTLGKIDGETGEVMDPGTFFSAGGPLDAWLERQKNNKRLPLTIRNTIKENESSVSKGSGTTEISPEQYRKNDEKFTRWGIYIITSITNQSFSHIRDQVIDIRKKQKNEAPPKSSEFSRDELLRSLKNIPTDRRLPVKVSVAALACLKDALWFAQQRKIKPTDFKPNLSYDYYLSYTPEQRAMMTAMIVEIVETVKNSFALQPIWKKYNLKQDLATDITNEYSEHISFESMMLNYLTEQAATIFYSNNFRPDVKKEMQLHLSLRDEQNNPDFTGTESYLPKVLDVMSRNATADPEKYEHQYKIFALCRELYTKAVRSFMVHSQTWQNESQP